MRIVLNSDSRILSWCELKSDATVLLNYSNIYECDCNDLLQRQPIRNAYVQK